MIHIAYRAHTEEVQNLPGYEEGKGDRAWLEANAPLYRHCDDGAVWPEDTHITEDQYYGLVVTTTGTLMGDDFQLLEDTAAMVQQAVGEPNDEVCIPCLVEVANLR